MAEPGAASSAESGPASMDEEAPPWAADLRRQLDALQQGTVLAQQEAQAAREDSRRSELLLLELQRRVDALRPPASSANNSLGSAVADLGSGLVGSVGSLWGGAKAGLGGGGGGGGGPSSSAAYAGASHDGAGLGALHAMMDAHFKQMEELCRRLGAKRAAGPSA